MVYNISNFNSEMGVYILVFEILMIIIYGIFIRTGTTTLSLTHMSYIQNMFYFTIAYTIINLKFRLLDWTMLTNFLFIVAITFQLNTLFIIFWYYSFQKTFNATTEISEYIAIVNIQCILAILVTTFQFIGKFNHMQIFTICLFEIFAFALNFSIQQYGILAITGGGGMTIFLFGLVFAIPIRKLCFGQDANIQKQEKQRYFTMTLKLIGLVVLIVLWPTFNSATAFIDKTALFSTTDPKLAEEAYIQTFLALLACIVTSLGLRIYGQKIIIDKFIRSIVNTGILVSSFVSVVIDPFASLLFGLFGPIIYFLFQKYGAAINFPGYSIDMILMCLLSGIFSGIFCAGRNNRQISLNNPYVQGGLQIACLFVTIGFALVFGILSGVVLRCLNQPNEQNNKDNTYWMIDQEILPLYPDDPILKKIMDKDIDKSLRQENVLFNLKQSYITEKTRENVELGKILKQQLDYESRIK